MKMNIFKTIILLVFVVLTMTSLQAKYFEILEFRELASDFTADREFVQDNNQRVCAALRVESATPIDITLRERVYKSATINGNKYLFFSHSEPSITIEAPGTEPYTLTPPGHSEFITGKVYLLRLRPQDKIDVKLNVVPQDAQIFFNNQPWRRQRVVPGDYQIKLTRAGYMDVEETIIVSPNNREFSYTMPSTAINLTINTTPPDAQITVNGQPWVVNSQMIQPGTHHVKAMKDGFMQHEETIQAEHTDVILAFNLTPVHTPPAAQQQTIISTPGSLPEMNAYDYTFRITSSYATPDNNVMITMQIINNHADDRDLIVKRGTKMFDNQGREWTVNKREIGNKEQTYYDINHRMIHRVPNELVLTFNEVSRTAAMVTLLELTVNDWKLQFRDFPISR